MKRQCAIIVYLFFCCFLMTGLSWAAGDWSAIKESDGIKLYGRPVLGTDLMEFMAVTVMDAKMEVIGEALRDVPRYPEWVADCSMARFEKKYDRNTFVMYLVLDPIMIEDRDIILKDEAVYDYDNGNARINFFSTEEVKIPVTKGRTRITIMNGVFQMEYLGREKTKFIYKLKADPAGNIPKKVAYGVMKYYPYTTLKKLREFVKKNYGKYAEIARGSGEEIQINERSKNEVSVRKVFGDTLIRVAKDKKTMAQIIASEMEGIKRIASSGGDYEIVRQVATNVCFKYADQIIKNEKTAENLKKNKKLIAEITEFMQTATEADHRTIDSILASYNK